MKPHYSEEEANAILRRAIDKTPAKDTMSLEQLEKIGAELGIHPEALRQAEAEHFAANGQHLKYAAFIAHEEAIFRNHFYTFLGVGTFVFLLNHFASDQFWWTLFPMLGWSICLLFHAARVYDRDTQQHVTSFFGYLRSTQSTSVPPAPTEQLPPAS